MKRTLLQVVQSYLNRVSSFYVNSIFETEESQQAAQIAEEIYYEMIQEYPNLLFTQKDRTLDAVSDASKPNFLLIPENVQDIRESQVYYNVAREDQGETLDWKAIQYLAPLEFIQVTQQGTDKDDNVDVITGFDGQVMLVRTNEFPTYCTSFDDKYITFDSYDKEYDSALQESKSRIVATEEPVFLIQDDFVIPVPDHLSETYLNMVLAECYSALRQEENARLNQKSRRMRIKLQQDNRAMGASGRPKTKYGRVSPTAPYSRSRGVSTN